MTECTFDDRVYKEKCSREVMLHGIADIPELKNLDEKKEFIRTCGYSKYNFAKGDLLCLMISILDEIENDT